MRHENDNREYKKPSERLNEILEREMWSDKQIGDVLQAVIMILDEQWEAEQCNHSEMENGQISNTICRKCGKNYHL